MFESIGPVSKHSHRASTCDNPSHCVTHGTFLTLAPTHLYPYPRHPGQDSNTRNPLPRAQPETVPSEGWGECPHEPPESSKFQDSSFKPYCRSTGFGGSIKRDPLPERPDKNRACNPGTRRPTLSGIIMSTRIGVVGLGRMGANMARRLKDCGYAVTALYDVRPEVVKELAAELGSATASTLAEVTAAADVILTVVTDDAAMDRIFAKKGDSLLKGANGRVFINCATVSPAIHVEVAKRSTKAGAASLEACMASSINQARAGTLYLMVGGDEPVFTRVREVLTKLSDDGKLLRYVGTTGKAAQLKALVNMVMNINTAGLAEGLALADAVGLDLTMVREVFSQTGANSRVLATDGEDMQNRDHSCFFSASHAAKDSGIALELGRKARLNLPLAETTFAQYSRMTRLGIGELDKSGIAELTFKGRAPKKPSAKSKAKKSTAKKPAAKPARKAGKR